MIVSHKIYYITLRASIYANEWCNLQYNGTLLLLLIRQYFRLDVFVVVCVPCPTWRNASHIQKSIRSSTRNSNVYDSRQKHRKFIHKAKEKVEFRIDRHRDNVRQSRRSQTNVYRKHCWLLKLSAHFRNGQYDFGRSLRRLYFVAAFDFHTDLKVEVTEHQVAAVNKIGRFMFGVRTTTKKCEYADFWN